MRIVKRAAVLNRLAARPDARLIAAPYRYLQIPAAAKGKVFDRMSVDEDRGALRFLHDPCGAMVYEVFFSLLQKVWLVVGSHVVS